MEANWLRWWMVRYILDVSKFSYMLAGILSQLSEEISAEERFAQFTNGNSLQTE
jgi:hypothetical protein